MKLRKQKKPLIYYYTIVLLILIAFNFLAMPWLTQRQVKQVDYGTCKKSHIKSTCQLF